MDEGLQGSKEVQEASILILKGNSMLKEIQEAINKDGHFLILIGIVLFGFMVAAAAPAMAWENTTFQYCIPIALNGSYNGTHMLELHNSSMGGYAHFSPTGTELRFYNGTCQESGQAQLNYYRDVWDTTNSSFVFVNLSSTPTGNISLYYGNDSVVSDVSDYNKTFYTDADVTFATSTGWNAVGAGVSIDTAGKHIDVSTADANANGIYSAIKGNQAPNNFAIYYHAKYSALTSQGGGPGLTNSTTRACYNTKNAFCGIAYNGATYYLEGWAGGTALETNLGYASAGVEHWGILTRYGTDYNLTLSDTKNMSHVLDTATKAAAGWADSETDYLWGFIVFATGYGSNTVTGWVNGTYLVDFPNPTFTLGSETSPSTDFTITLNSPNATSTYLNYTIPLQVNVSGNNATFECWYSVNGTNSSNFSVVNNTLYNSSFIVLNGTHTLTMNCTNGTLSKTTSATFVVEIGRVYLTLWDEALSNYTIANMTTILAYNSSSSMNFTGNNFSWWYSDIPYGNTTIVASYNNITREVTITNNQTNSYNLTLSFPALTGTYYFLIQNSYNNPIEGALVTFTKLDGTLITQRYSQSDGFVNDIFLTRNIPVTVSLTKSGYISKTMTFTPYITTQLPVKVTMMTFSSNGTEYDPFANLSYSCSPSQLIVNNNTAITCILSESNSQLLTNVMRVYYVNYSGSYLSKTTTCLDPSTCTFTFTTNKTSSKFRFNLTMNLSYGNYSSIREYVTNGTADIDLPTSTDLGVGVWKFIFFVIMLAVLAITWGYIGPLALLIIPLIIGIGMSYHVFGIGELIILLLVVFILFMKMV